MDRREVVSGIAITAAAMALPTMSATSKESADVFAIPDRIRKQYDAMDKIEKEVHKTRPQAYLCRVRVEGDDGEDEIYYAFCDTLEECESICGHGWSHSFATVEEREQYLSRFTKLIVG